MQFEERVSAAVESLISVVQSESSDFAAPLAELIAAAETAIGALSAESAPKLIERIAVALRRLYARDFPCAAALQSLFAALLRAWPNCPSSLSALSLFFPAKELFKLAATICAIAQIDKSLATTELFALYIHCAVLSSDEFDNAALVEAIFAFFLSGESASRRQSLNSLGRSAAFKRAFDCASPFDCRGMTLALCRAALLNAARDELADCERTFLCAAASEAFLRQWELAIEETLKLLRETAQFEHFDACDDALGFELNGCEMQCDGCRLLAAMELAAAPSLERSPPVAALGEPATVALAATNELCRVVGGRATRRAIAFEPAQFAYVFDAPSEALSRAALAQRVVGVLLDGLDGHLQAFLYQATLAPTALTRFAALLRRNPSLLLSARVTRLCFSTTDLRADLASAAATLLARAALAFSPRALFGWRVGGETLARRIYDFAARHCEEHTELLVELLSAELIDALRFPALLKAIAHRLAQSLQLEMLEWLQTEQPGLLVVGAAEAKTLLARLFRARSWNCLSWFVRPKRLGAQKSIRAPRREGALDLRAALSFAKTVELSRLLLEEGVGAAELSAGFAAFLAAEPRAQPAIAAGCRLLALGATEVTAEVGVWAVLAGGTRAVAAALSSNALSVLVSAAAEEFCRAPNELGADRLLVVRCLSRALRALRERKIAASSEPLRRALAQLSEQIYDFPLSLYRKGVTLLVELSLCLSDLAALETGVRRCLGFLLNARPNTETQSVAHRALLFIRQSLCRLPPIAVSERVRAAVAELFARAPPPNAAAALLFDLCARFHADDRLSRDAFESVAGELLNCAAEHIAARALVWLRKGECGASLLRVLRLRAEPLFAALDRSECVGALRLLAELAARRETDLVRLFAAAHCLLSADAATAFEATAVIGRLAREEPRLISPQRVAEPLNRFLTSLAAAPSLEQTVRTLTSPLAMSALSHIGEFLAKGGDAPPFAHFARCALSGERPTIAELLEIAECAREDAKRAELRLNGAKTPFDALFAFAVIAEAILYVCAVCAAELSAAAFDGKPLLEAPFALKESAARRSAARAHSDFALLAECARRIDGFRSESARAALSDRVRALAARPFAALIGAAPAEPVRRKSAPLRPKRAAPSATVRKRDAPRSPLRALRQSCQPCL